MNGTLISKLKDKTYRDNYVLEHLCTVLATQIQTLRHSQNLTQGELGKKIGTAQNVISRLEDPDYGKFSLQTLLKLASAFDVALTVKFTSFGNFALEFSDISTNNLIVVPFDEELRSAELPNTRQLAGSTVSSLTEGLSKEESFLGSKKVDPSKSTPMPW